MQETEQARAADTGATTRKRAGGARVRAGQGRNTSSGEREAPRLAGAVCNDSAQFSEKAAKKAANRRDQRRERGQARKLAQALEERLRVLTEALDAAQVSEKGIEMIKEIKELHAMLGSLRQQGPLAGQAEQAREAGGQRLLVAWAEDAAGLSGPIGPAGSVDPVGAVDPVGSAGPSGEPDASAAAHRSGDGEPPHEWHE